MGRRVDVEEKLIGHYKSPRADVLLVLHDEIQDVSQTENGLLIPSTAIQKNERVGTVVSVGSKVVGLQAGDRVLIDKRLGITLYHEDPSCRLVMVSQDQVAALLDGKPCEKDYDLVRDGLSL